ncbi:MAG: GMC family oxidoreductase [Bdellovibrionaceae bacterium]|nr:GMC family oxidoreductase [Pseudobdellovibrionaceae bacterium]
MGKIAPEIIETHWDAIIVGTGIGGAVAGYDWSQAGKKVLFIEKGPGATVGSDSLPIWKDSILNTQTNKTFHPFLGEGIGGSSRLYGMVMERLESCDLIDNGGAWPLPLNEWERFFVGIENLFQVHFDIVPGGFSPLIESLKSKGVNPLPLKLASRICDKCEYCQSRICEKSCKVDAWSGPLSVALKCTNTKLLTNCKVQTILHNKYLVTGVKIDSDGEVQTLSAKNIFLAAGALSTPFLLNRSSSIFYPQGLGVRSGQLGRNLMRHFVDLYVLKWPQSQGLSAYKSLGINDFYVDPKDGNKLGIFQSFGSLPLPHYVISELKEQLPILKFIPGSKYLLNYFIKSIFSNPIMASIIEDPPEFENGLDLVSENQLRLNYKISTKGRRRIDRSREIGQQIFSPFLKRILPEAENNTRLAHVCGTCRMGTDPETSVVDLLGRLHEMENLFITDSSVFPSSTGKNPSLIIAANALRIAESARSKNNDDRLQRLVGSHYRRH